MHNEKKIICARVWLFAALLFLLSTPAQAQKITFNTTIQPSTCDLSIKSGTDSAVGSHSGSMQLGSVTTADINESSELDPVAGKALVLQLVGCKGVGTGVQNPMVTISGDDAGVGGHKIFRNGASTADGSGFVIFYDATGVEDTKQVDPSGTVWTLPNGVKPTTTLPADRYLNFWVALSKIPGKTLSSGTVNANVNFEFKWQ